MKLSGLLSASLVVASIAHAQHGAATVLVDQFYDPHVSNQAFLANAHVTTPDELKTLLHELYKTHPSALFSQVGHIAHFDITPDEYGVKHAINYYLPTSYRADGRAAVLIIMHGGGESTNTYDSAMAVSQQYMQDFTEFADRNGVIIVGPSSSLGWSFVTRILISHTIDLVNEQLAADPDRIYLWGHSMGAMGITREAHWLVSRTAASLPNAGGMQDEFRITPILKTYFDTRFIHSQGTKDQFTAFVDRTKAVEREVRGLENSLGKKSGYRVIWEDRDHPPDMKTVISLLEGDVLKSARDKYRTDIHPMVVRLDTHANPLGPDVHAYAVTKYFWIETPNLVNELPRKEFSQGQGENFVSFAATVAGNVYDVQLADSRIKSVRILVSSKMVDLSKPITVNVNGTTRYHGIVYPDVTKMLEIARGRRDRTYVFETYIDLTL